MQHKTDSSTAKHYITYITLYTLHYINRWMKVVNVIFHVNVSASSYFTYAYTEVKKVKMYEIKTNTKSSNKLIKNKNEKSQKSSCPQ